MTAALFVEKVTVFVGKELVSFREDVGEDAAVFTLQGIVSGSPNRGKESELVESYS